MESLLGAGAVVSSMPDALDFEQPLLELETRIAALPGARTTRSERATRSRGSRSGSAGCASAIYASLTAWQRTQLARHPKRPHTRDFVKLLFDDFVELHGDRLFGDDAAIVGGLARFEGALGGGHRPPEGAGHAREDRAELRHAAPRGLSQGAAAACELAAKFGKPIVTFIDTPGAYPGIGAEERGQAEAIARNLQRDGRPAGRRSSASSPARAAAAARWPSAWATAC